MLEEEISINVAKIPIHRSRRGRPRENRYKYPFGSMQVGDSFDVKLEDAQDKATAPRITAAARDYKNREGIPPNKAPHFLVRTYRKAGIVRCWREE